MSKAAELSSIEVDRSTHFLFEHRVFQLKGARFALTDDGTTPAFHVELGALNAALALNTLCSEFGIEPKTTDGELLVIVEKSLRFVKEIRPGDSIPRELLDGTASWSVEERHRLRAKAQIYAKAMGAGLEIKDAGDAVLTTFLADPNTLTRLKQAGEKIAQQIGNNMDGDTVVDRVDAIGRELAYIEALQEQCGHILAIVPKLGQLSRVYRSDRAIVDEISRVRTLLLRPIEHFDGIFAQLSNRQDDIIKSIDHIHDYIDVIRGERDDLHQSMMLWEPILAGWRRIEMTRHTETEAKIAELYRFTARHYLSQSSWSKDGK